MTTLFSFGCGMPVVQGAVTLQSVLTTEVRKSHCTHCPHKNSVNVNYSVCNPITAVLIVFSYMTAKYFPTTFTFDLYSDWGFTCSLLTCCWLHFLFSSVLFLTSGSFLHSTVSLIGNGLQFQKAVAQDVALTITLSLKRDKVGGTAKEWWEM